jgi:sugar transferase (PEP-CTERM system associated)
MASMKNSIKVSFAPDDAEPYFASVPQPILRPQPSIRLLNAYFPTRLLLLAASEVITMFSALLIAHYVRFGSDSTLVVFYENGWKRIAIVCAVCLLCLYYFDLYDSIILASSREVFLRLVQSVGSTCIILALLYYFYPSIRIRVALFVPAVLFMGACLIGWRKIFWMLAYSRGLAERVLVLGDAPLGQALAKEINDRPALGLRLIGFVGCASEKLGRLGALQYLGDVAELVQIVAAEQINRIVVTMKDRRGMLPVERLMELKARGVSVEDGSGFYETLTGKVSLEALQLSQLLFSSGFFVSRGMLFYKRISSVLISLACLVLALPLMALIALATWIDSGTPIFFRQKRVGEGGRVFILYKFRSMKIQGNVNANGNGKPQPAQEMDERFTRVGSWIRRLRIDELPQLYNVLRGDMHFIGPRPFMLEEEEELAQQIPFYRYRWSVKPGATGWAQIHRAYCANLEDNKEKLSYDLFYIKNMSVGLDLLIIFKTVKTLLLGRGSR